MSAAPGIGARVFLTAIDAAALIEALDLALEDVAVRIDADPSDPDFAQLVHKLVSYRRLRDGLIPAAVGGC